MSPFAHIVGATAHAAFGATPEIEGVDIRGSAVALGSHLTIVCSERKPRAAIYFVRRLRTATSTPVFLYDARDLRRVINAFEQLWFEAEVYEQERAPSGAEEDLCDGRLELNWLGILLGEAGGSRPIRILSRPGFSAGSTG